MSIRFVNQYDFKSIKLTPEQAVSQALIPYLQHGQGQIESMADEIEHLQKCLTTVILKLPESVQIDVMNELGYKAVEV